jgi:hypothetical protein
MNKRKKMKKKIIILECPWCDPESRILPIILTVSRAKKKRKKKLKSKANTNVMPLTSTK